MVRVLGELGFFDLSEFNNIKRISRERYTPGRQSFGVQKLCFCQVLSLSKGAQAELAHSKDTVDGSYRMDKEVPIHLPHLIYRQSVPIFQVQLLRPSNSLSSVVVCAGSRKRIACMPISLAALTFSSKSSMNTDSFGATPSPSRAS